ncbi:MAG: sodium-independent anion transporter [Phormidesmis priestleyi]|uniref:Sodium-independent anion transporter n=1 Tax=Phormidesmis priestleyi TaxID=268141 RepID=A0A2W4WKU6_9CYAN|nr:MAG: sodium-independent anion transporter [Phormidesmis priestleyi]
MTYPSANPTANSTANPNQQSELSAWFSNIPADLLAGVVVALALIPEAIAFSIIAGVDPKVGLYASFTMAVTIAFLGGRPGMISAATGSMALLMVDLVKNYGLDYLLIATLVTGLLQVIWGSMRIGRIMKYVPRAVLVGFVNALAILIFNAQLPQFVGQGLLMYGMVAAGLAIIYLLPRLTASIPIIKSIPSPLVAIVVLTAVAIMQGLNLPTVGDMGDLPSALPAWRLPNVPFNLATLQIVLPVALTMSAVGLLESFLTASVLDDMTDTNSDKNREARGQGMANLITGMFGGMAGCAMIGQSVINIKSGGRQRLSTLSAGVFLLFFILAMRAWVSLIPMAALVAVMFMVSISTFNWASLVNFRKLPKSETMVMIVTVVTTVITHNLALGVMVGIALSAIAFSRKIGKLITLQTDLSEDGKTRTYYVLGQLFFVSANNFREAFNLHEKIENVVIDLTHAHLWDQSAVMAIDKVVLKFRTHGSTVKLVGMNEASATLMERLAVHDKPNAVALASGH